MGLLIVRDDTCCVLGGFAHCYGQATNTIVESRAVIDDLRICKQLGLRNFVIESDSSVIVGWFLASVCNYWNLWDF